MKKLAVIGPCLPDKNDSALLMDGLAFLKGEYDMDYFDPLESMDACTTHESFLLHWRGKMLDMAHKYDGFIGFSLGGMLIKKCMDDTGNKPSILFSTPSRMNSSLRRALTVIVNLLKAQREEEGMHLHNKWVHYPHPWPEVSAVNAQACARVIVGLGHVLQMGDLSTHKIQHVLQFVGASSRLVTKNNIPPGEAACTVTVRNAGMRVLQGNPQHCQAIIHQFLKRHIT